LKLPVRIRGLHHASGAAQVTVVRRFECMKSLPPVVALHDWTIEIAGKQFGLTQATRSDHTELWFGGSFTFSLPLSAPTEGMLLLLGLGVLICVVLFLFRKRGIA
jgi:hypothetical protein